MSQSPGLALYLFARSRLAGLLGGVRTATAAADDSRQRIGQPDQPRPAGGLIWFNAPSATALRALAELLRSIREERSNIAFVVTTPPGMDAAGSGLPRGTVFQTAPLDAVPFARAFLDHWKPDVAVFLEGSLPAALIDQTHARKIPLFLIDGRSEVSGSGWFRRTFGMTKSLLQRFDRILVQNPLTARQFRRMGAPPWRLETAGKMEESTGALPCTEAERDAMARLMRSRPVWLAVTVPQVEESAVLSAFKMALNLSHRLLLIIVPEDPAGGPALADLIAQDHGLNVSLRSRDEEPDEEDQVYVADVEGELGLWYRLAPITYLGGTLLAGASRRHPFEPAALGSAILHGPMVGQWAETFTRLDDARAARLVHNAGEMGEAVSDLMAPDKAALMAHSAWSVTSSGAEVTLRVQRLLLETLATVQDGKTAPAARAVPHQTVPNQSAPPRPGGS